MKLIHTVRGVGYTLRERDRDAPTGPPPAHGAPVSLRLKLVLALVALSAAATAAIGLFSYRTTATQLKDRGRPVAGGGSVRRLGERPR